MLKRLYDWTLALAARRHALWALAGVSFAESSFFPLPPDILLIPMVIANRARAWLIAGVCTVASVAGGVFGYAIGFFLFETVGRRVVEFYGYGEKFETFQGWYNEYGLLIVFAAGLTPLPYKVFTIASGVTGLGFVTFLVGSVVSRGARFYIEAALLWWLGEPIRRFLERNLQWATAGFVVLLVGGFVVLRLAV
ncbi:MAG: DedA family protein [Proteobacteria bacterium]|nr:DedA family protein [Pseudomonadota bacterium]